ncbi:hypothetical protein GVN20_01870 [Runella sp. CRIBMP]|uniref:hypothetical protein n=1 Tax=Runella sp. CRIBMP TaxID=2683261 RepID=UPI00141307A6|nr:hypothetical protein [Runella sp. CRIBMP]NBB18089.1 hypothetical protein [Runella sp. CRIBMP]
MKNLLLLVFLVGMVGCREKALSPEELQPLVGKWRLSAVQPTGKNEWEDVTQSSQYQFEIRYDGVILDQNSLPACCAPKYLSVNGKTFTIVPKESLPNNPQCALVSCLACDTWNMDLQGDKLIVSYCEGSGRNRFVKL